MSLSKIEKNGVDVYKPQCNRCVHYLKNGKCKAFPSMIPIQIFACHKCGHVNKGFQPKE